jgi:hypothetical protein
MFCKASSRAGLKCSLCMHYLGFIALNANLMPDGYITKYGSRVFSV